MKLPVLREDRANHALYGLAIYIAALPLVGPWWAFGVSCAVTAFKDYVYDRRRPDRHTVDHRDVLSGVAGAAAGLAASLLA